MQLHEELNRGLEAFGFCVCWVMAFRVHPNASNMDWSIMIAIFLFLHNSSLLESLISITTTASI